MCLDGVGSRVQFHSHRIARSIFKDVCTQVNGHDIAVHLNVGGAIGVIHHCEHGLVAVVTLRWFSHPVNAAALATRQRGRKMFFILVI